MQRFICFDEIRRIANLAWPLLIAQVTQTLMGVSDTIMAGHYKAIDMAAVAIGFSITMPVLFFLQGLILALPPIVARLNGAKQQHKIANATQQLAYMVMALALLVFAVSFAVPDLLALSGMSDELQGITADYVQAVLFAAPAFTAYQILRNFCEALSITKPSMVIMLIGLVINVPANYILIYGKLGLPALGGAGCGIATALVFVCMGIATLVYVLRHKRLDAYGLFRQWYKPHLGEMKHSFGLGFPIALTILFEVTLFAVVAVLLAPAGANMVASHQIALNFSSLMFMFPLSLGMATTIRVGFLLGDDTPQHAGLAARSAIALGLGIAAFTALTTILLRHQIPLLYSANPNVIEIASGLMLLAAMFQLSDAIQVISAGALRGYKDTRAMSVITFVAYWLIGLPVGCILALTDWWLPAMQASGFWIGFIAGLTSAAVMLGIRLAIVHRRAIVATDIATQEPAV